MGQSASEPSTRRLRERVVDALRGFVRRSVDRPDLKPAAVAIALVERGPAFLLTRRVTSLRGHAGQWALPGGRTEAGETHGEAARRELAEELGLDLGADAELACSTTTRHGRAT